MSAIFILIAFSLIVALLFLGAFFWSVRSGQYDDDHTPAMRMLFDDTKPQASQTKPTNQSSDIQSKSFNSES